MPAQVDDEEPVPALRRMGAMAASEVDEPRDPLMIRATRYAVLLPLAYRIFLLPVVWLSMVIGSGAAAVPTVLAWVGFAGNIASVVWVLRVPDQRGRVTKLLLYADIVYALVATVLVGDAVPAELFWPGSWIGVVYLTGTVALWTMSRGVGAGLFVALLGFAAQCLAVWLAPLPDSGAHEAAGLVRNGGLLLVAAVTGIGSLVLLGLATRLALAIGLRLGHDAERVRTERALHDTVLQALEAIALSSDADAADPRDQLVRVRQAARGQANELRRVLRESVAPDGLAAELASIATEMARDGLRAELSLSDIGDDRLSDVRRVAVRDAAREALRNTIKHAGTHEVVLRMEELDGGVAVITRDHGVGYDEDERPAGFGVSESMRARLAEVGGWCRIESRPGRGTRVTLWVPR
ncbi:ATP-binding protein [Amycolatopsis acidicola]|uniref:ATP-binding protein n=2 Tax=Amycolatopsis acidicola TaxID=2596893 RepID=A0A5N0UVP8_9PSEU|nr:ATP-binding protein [Amycolatopsis acidicola]